MRLFMSTDTHISCSCAFENCDSTVARHIGKTFPLCDKGEPASTDLTVSHSS